MKKKLVLTLVAPMMCLSLVGCHSNVGMKLTYGTYISTEDDSKNDAKQITYKDLAFRMEENSQYSNENFLLTIAPTNGCVCWAQFQSVLKQFIKETHYLVYQINCDEFGENNYGLNFQEGHVTFAIIKSGKIVKQYMGDDVLDSAQALKSEVNKFVRAPELYYIEEPFLNEAIKTGETVLVEYIQESCGDCSYVNPKVLWPYAYQNVFKTKMYIMDIDYLLGTPDHQNFKDLYGLSNAFEPDFGYNEKGYVPTFQYYERGKLLSASVFFNDTVDKVDGEYKVIDSYYTAERIQKLGYAQGVENNVLKGLTLQESDVNVFNAKYYWRQSSAAQYHKPLLEAFLNTYTK